jgi:CelD/BcsL family acetyltransferase involved in cellulose biosynthesis
MPVVSAPAHDRCSTHVVEATESAWSSFVSAHPDATAYHSWQWRGIFERSFGYRSWYLLAADDETGAITGALPLFLVTSPFGRRLVAVPFRDRGGLLWIRDSAFTELVAEARRIASKVGATTVEFKSTEPYPPAAAAAAGLRERFYWIRSVVPLREFATVSLWRRLGTKRRSPIRHAQDAGMVCEDGGIDADAWYDLHLRTQQRLGLPPFPRRFFRTLLETLVPCGAARLLLAKRGSAIMAATILLDHRSDVIYGYAASTSEGQRHAAGDVVLYSALDAAIAAGRDTFDMGSDAPLQEGLLFFKKRWFAVQTPIPTYTLGADSAGVSDSSSPRYRLLRKGFEHLPRPVLRLTGEATKYFG